MTLDLQPARRWWDQRTPRERWTVLGGGLAALLLALDQLVCFPIDRRVQREHLAVQELQTRIATLHEQAAQARAAATATTAIAAAADSEAQLHRRVQAAQAAAAALRQRAAEAARLPETLRAITATVGSLRVLALDLGGDATSAGADGGVATASSAVAPAGATGSGSGGRLYRLPITLKVSGSYDELQLLLAQIERHAENLQWATLMLERGDWPAIQLTFKAHVLSAEPRWGAAS